MVYEKYYLKSGLINLSSQNQDLRLSKFLNNNSSVYVNVRLLSWKNCF